jgi:hypothetical protein
VGAGLPELWGRGGHREDAGADFFCPGCKCALSVPDYYPRWYNWSCWFAAFGGSVLMITHLALKWPIEVGTSALWVGVVFDILCVCWFMVLRLSCIRLAWRFFPPDVVDPRKARYISMG